MGNKLKEILIEQKIKKLQGSGNICPQCKKQGYFGSISKYLGEKHDYLICGWCNQITKIKKRPHRAKATD